MAKEIETAMFAAFNAAADRCGTIFEPSSPGFSMRIGGACTKHPLARDVAAVLIAECRRLGGEARAIKTNGLKAAWWLVSDWSL